MAINKVVYGNQTLIDLTTDTVTSSDDILAGKVGHLRDGTVVTGTASGGDQHGTIWQDGQGYVHLDDESGIALQSKTATPTESQQVIEADTGYYALDKVTVGAISSSYVGSGVSRRSSSDLTVSGATVTAPAGYYSAQASKSVATGTAGTPTATKGTVSNHAVTVTPSVTNTTGYITGGTKTGTGVSVSASELVSGTKSITENGTGIDVTNYASVDVDVVSTGGPFTATITRTGIRDKNYPVYCCVTHNGTHYYTKGDTFVFDAGDTLRVTIETVMAGQRFLKENGVVIASGTNMYWTYDYTLPAYNVDIQLYQIFTSYVGSVNISKSESNCKLIASTTYQVNTTSTTAITVGTFSTGDTSIWTSDKMVYVKIRRKNSRENGYYFGSDCIFSINAPGNNLTATESYLMYGTSYYQNSAGNLINYNLQRTDANATVQGYGVYATKVYSNGDIDINARYDSSNTLRIDGTFYVDVYLLDWPGGIGPFNE